MHRTYIGTVQSEMRKISKNNVLKAVCVAMMMMIAAVASGREGFAVREIPDEVFLRMKQGGSYPQGCPVKRSELRYLTLRHWNMQGEEKAGELVCNAQIADDLLAIFEELYDAHYPIHSVRLIDDFGADDEASVAANNTSSFCYRKVAGTKTLSRHARGMAIDINPKDNPMVKPKRKGGPIPKVAHTITESDICYKAFRKRGFTWGGHWRTVKDYQHFQR